MLAGAILGGLGALGKTISGFSQMNMANKINPVWNEVKENPLANQNLGATKNLFYGKNRAFTQAEANIRQAQSDQMSNAQRNATDSATLLATGAGAVGNSNQAFSNLAGQESQQQAGVLDNLSRAYAMSINEGDKVNANKLMKYQLDSQAQAALRQSGMNNIFGGVGDLAGGIMQYGNYKNAKDFNKTLAGMGGAQSMGSAQSGMGALDGNIAAQNNPYAKYAGMEQQMPQRYGASPGLANQDFTNGNTGFKMPMPANISSNYMPNYRGMSFDLMQNWNRNQ
jgi:hypothetical protein